MKPQRTQRKTLCTLWFVLTLLQNCKGERMNKAVFTISIIAAILLITCIATFECVACEKIGFPVLKGPYLGQKMPGPEAELFAPGIISTGIYTRDVAIMPDGKELYFCMSVGRYRYATILFTKQVNGIWTEPQVAPFATNPDYMNFEPAISPDGQKLFFLSTRPVDHSDKGGNQDIWVVHRKGDSWGSPINLGPPINTEAGEFFPSVTKDGTLYFTRGDAKTRINFIYRSRLVEGKYTEPEKLPEQVNCGTNRFNAFVAPDESYIIVPAMGRKDSLGGVDYYIVFRNPDDTWCEPINMGEKINSAIGAEWSPYVSPDGKIFFFMASRGLPTEKKPKELTYKFLKHIHNCPRNGSADIYWIDAKIIKELKPE